ncbi:DUF3325 family protein [Sphingomonas yabuuchiae]|uniref:Uncharacterized protein n=1 Tax=Sphingomonas yabuuchiae TaxID=172044 RepID=A0AA41A0N0_9SPHN|nr:hypothetical protein [Sphingomonas yabuuchiae]MBB4609689.1 hypothetical protein [Sphingomonas yabuuchiae]MBN3558001.1 hypothetical protein [Sphingomonas yabuuchiae]
MLDTIALCFVGFWLLAAGSYRHAKEAGTLHDARLRTGLKLLGGAVMLLALSGCGTAVTGERIVRMFGAASIAGVALNLILSVRAQAAFAPLRAVNRLAGRTRTSPSAAPAVRAPAYQAVNSRAR